MKRNIAAASAGLLFGAGLAISGMTVPQRVQGFLDFAGSWDPSLMLVMLGAIGVHLPAYWLMRRRSRPALDSQFHIPGNRKIDGRLVLGAALFGIGWGLAGYCPGPAIATLTQGLPSIVVFSAILVGIFLHERIFGALSKAPFIARGDLAPSSIAAAASAEASRGCEQPSRAPC
jgi:uncharacterized membrane protein YedE/YeeE